MTNRRSFIANQASPSWEHVGRSTYSEATHGGIDLLELQRLGIDAADIVDMSSNVLAVPHPLSVRTAIANACTEQYPDRYCIRLRQAIAAYLGLNSERILVGNGCCELIHLAASQWVKHDEAALIVGPTFAEYRRAISLSGGSVVDVLASEAENFAVPIFEIESCLKQRAYGTVWICNPNNPTGQSIDPSLILRWAEEYPESCFVVDESYIECSNPAESLVSAAVDNLIVLRSMTKAFAVAGLRLGYLVASRDRIVALEQRRIPWSVNSVAQAAGAAVLHERTHYLQAVAALHQEKARLVDALVQQGFSPVHSDTNFFLLPANDPSALRQGLLEMGILVRDCNSFGISHHVRIAAGDRRANQRLIHVLSLKNVSSDDFRHDPSIGLRASAQNPIVHSDSATAEPVEAFRNQLHQLFRLRRDVRRFRSDALPAGAVRRWIEAACLAPSVGLSQPWRFVSVVSSKRREQVVHEFEQQNEIAALQYESHTALEYRQLKLAGLREAPEQIAVFVDSQPAQGRRLGRMTMPESVAYSVVAAIQNFWLAARCEGVGVGWVSILQPESIRQILDVPEHWCLIAYLCIGYPVHDDVEVPELESHGWEHRRSLEEHWYEK